MSQNESKVLLDSYTLTGKGEILEKLRIMEKQKILLTAVPSGHAAGFITTLLKILPDKGMLAIDASANAQLNKDLLAAESVRFTGQMDGIETRFTAERISEAVMDKQNVFAVPIPQSLYWLQRRKFYRVPLPLTSQLKCWIPLGEDNIGEFPVVNLSLHGVGLIDRSKQFDRKTEVGAILDNCRMDLPGGASEYFGLNFRHAQILPTHDGRGEYLRMGFGLLGCSRHFEVCLQKFIFELELQKKRTDELIRS